MNKFKDTNEEFAILVDSYCKIPDKLPNLCYSSQNK